MHMRKLEELEYVLVHRGGRGQSFAYELLYDGGGKDGKPFLMGLIDEATLHAYDGEKEHAAGRLEHPSSPLGDGEETGGCEPNPSQNGSNPSTPRLLPKNNGHLAALEEASLIASYPQPLSGSI
jgi:hypothetical protein